MLTAQQVDDYLARIGARREAPSLAALTMLMERQLTSVPFETVGLRRAGCAPDLRLDALFDKIVRKRRGGYCFELNKLFEALLVALGYDARPCLARSADVPGQRDPINHRGLLVSVEGVLMSADVGYGGPAPGGPLRLEASGPQEVGGECVEAVRLDEAWWRVDRFRASTGERLGVLELCIARVEDEDFAALNLACSLPGTEFREQDLVNLRTADGHVALTGRRLVIRSGASRRCLELGETEVDEVLRRFFGLSY